MSFLRGLASPEAISLLWLNRESPSTYRSFATSSHSSFGTTPWSIHRHAPSPPPVATLPVFRPPARPSVRHASGVEVKNSAVRAIIVVRLPAIAASARAPNVS